MRGAALSQTPGACLVFNAARIGGGGHAPVKVPVAVGVELPIGDAAIAAGATRGADGAVRISTAGDGTASFCCRRMLKLIGAIGGPAAV